MTPKNTDTRRAASLQAAREAWEGAVTAAKSVWYDSSTERITVELNDGAAFVVPVRSIQGLEDASADRLAEVELSPSGDGLRWDALDVDVDVAALRAGIFGTRSWMARLGELGGRTSTPAKAKAARTNGRLGGRPSSLGKTFWSRLAEAGVGRQFVLKSLIPTELQTAWIEATLPRQRDDLIQQIATYVHRIYGWTLEDIVGVRPLTIPAQIGGVGRFKMPANANESQASAYVVYAHYLALLALTTTSHLPKRALETDPLEVRRAISLRYGEVTLESTIRHLWDRGVTVLPLFDQGVFHGACWRVGGRNTIVLKQSSRSEARWLFDVLHERYHATQQPELDEFSVIEASETSTERRNSPEERAASNSAGNVVLEGRAEFLTEMCVDQARSSIERLKNAVQFVARREGVPVGVLANYVAFRLSLQGQNWWGAAANLQELGEPGQIARKLFLEHAKLEVLNRSDRSLLERALTLSQGRDR